MTCAWTWAAAKASGTSHLGEGLPCQDCFAFRTFVDGESRETLIIALADGAGSAPKAEVGAALATSLFADIVHDAFADGKTVDDVEEVLTYAVAETKRAIDLKVLHDGRDPNDYASTFIAAILTPNGGAVGQIGDGAAVVRNGTAVWEPVHWPDHGEYANSTSFLSQDDALAQLRIAKFKSPITRMALFSDGLERLVLDFRSKSAHAPFFEGVFRRLRTGGGFDLQCSSELEMLLASDRVNALTDDDKSIFCAALVGT